MLAHRSMPSRCKMAAGSGLLMLLMLADCSSPYLTHALAVRGTVVLPHTAPPGFVVTALQYWGQTFSVDYSHNKNASKHFTVSNSGDLITNSDISHLLGQKISLRVSNKLAGERWKEKIHLLVKAGDGMLLFPEQHYRGHVSENKPAGWVVSGLDDLHAYIANKPCPVHYSISSGPTDLFNLHKKDVEGVDLIQIRTKNPLDHEKQPHYNLVIKAWVDDMNIEPAFVKVKIFVDNENDNVPKFEKSGYEASITTDTPAMTTVLKIRASDLDGDKPEYRIDHSSEVFKIDSKTGDLILKSRSKLEPKSYFFVAHAVDRDGRESQPASIHIKVNENPLLFHPKVKPQILHRSKRSTRPMKVVLVSETTTGTLFSIPPQDSRERFSFKTPAPKMLRLNSQGSVSLIPGEKLDYEETPEIDCYVIITRTDIPSGRLYIQFAA